MTGITGFTMTFCPECWLEVPILKYDFHYDMCYDCRDEKIEEGLVLEDELEEDALIEDEW